MILRIFSFCLLVHYIPSECSKVKIKQGVLEGAIWKTKKGREFHAFLSIPFAQPPIGELRFQAPVPADGWEGVRSATENHAVCPQRNIYTRSEIIEGDEDCLYLNVYTPKLAEENDQLFPVMVFLHGGGWLCCSGNFIYYDPRILLDRDIVLVVPNYRLGALGFLSTSDEVAPGNNGLKDQSLALKWIKENIEKFGGDPQQIILFGESAGGASTHFHMMSPLSKGLLKGGISQSGTAFTNWALSANGETQENSKKLARLLGCPEAPSTEMLKCLRKVDAFTIVAQDRQFMEWDTDPMIPFKPVIEPDFEGAFLSQHPADIIKAGKIANVPWITGINSEDGALRSAAVCGRSGLHGEFLDKLDEILPVSLFYNRIAVDPKKVTHKIKEFYFKNKEVNRESRMNVTNLFTDSWFLEGADKAVRLHLKYGKAPVYLYLFGYRGTSSYTEIFGDPDNDYGVCHADELQYLFPVGDILFPDKKLNKNDEDIANIMTHLWTNFAKVGNPTKGLDRSVVPEDWTPVRSLDLEYYLINDSRDLRMSKALYPERIAFWRNLFATEEDKNRITDEL